MGARICWRIPGLSVSNGSTVRAWQPGLLPMDLHGDSYGSPPRSRRQGHSRNEQARPDPRVFCLHGRGRRDHGTAAVFRPAGVPPATRPRTIGGTDSRRVGAEKRILSGRGPLGPLVSPFILTGYGPAGIRFTPCDRIQSERTKIRLRLGGTMQMTIGDPIVITVTANSARIGSVVCSRLTKPGKSHEPMTGYMPCPALKARHQRTRTSPRPSE